MIKGYSNYNNYSFYLFILTLLMIMVRLINILAYANNKIMYSFLKSNDNFKSLTTLSNNEISLNSNSASLSATSPLSLVLYTFNFGVTHHNGTLLNSRNYFLSHLRSISNFQYSTILYITDKLESNIPYPANVVIVLTEWRDLIGRLEIFLNVSFPNLKASTSYYKICDFKPIFPILYPELFEKYSWIGWIDNDMWLSSKIIELVSKVNDDKKKVAINFLNPSFVKKSKAYSWGPISIFRGDFYRNEITGLLNNFRFQNIMIKVFNISINTNFAEWGCSHITKSALGWDYSFSRVLFDVFSKKKRLKLVFATNYYRVGLTSDYISCVKRSRGIHCANCILTVHTNNSQIHTSNSANPYSTEEALLCHFEAGKKRLLNYSIQFNMNDVLHADVFNTTWDQGIRIRQRHEVSFGVN